MFNIFQTKIIKRVNQQETSAYLYAEGSSETACKITSRFSEYLKYNNKTSSINNIRFLEWFIGFTEGDGSFIVSKNKVYFDITQTLSDIQVLYYIKKELGFGSIIIRNEPHRNVGVFYITGQQNFYKLITIFNGNLCSEYKKIQFQKWLSVFNTQYKQNITLKFSNMEPSLNNGWLTGFFDAEGSLSARIKVNKQLKSYPMLTFTISQKDREILDKIKYIIYPELINNIDLLENFKYVTYDKSWNGWRVSFSSFKKIKLMLSYFKIYNLKTKKYLTYLNFLKISNLMDKKEHLTIEGSEKIKKLISK
jgi:LAGLIDADG endonuclease